MPLTTKQRQAIVNLHQILARSPQTRRIVYIQSLAKRLGISVSVIIEIFEELDKSS